MEQILVGELFHEETEAGIHRVSARVGAELLWFESSNAQLRLSPEGFASALLIPAMSHGRNLVFEDPLCPEWLANTGRIMDYFSRWMGWKPIRIESRFSGARPEPSPGVRRALCFSGGVDSFFSLLTYPKPIDTLVLIHGYDIWLNDEEGARVVFETVQRVAAEKGLHAALIRTNYRDHPIAGRKYRFSYAGALAAIGHLLDGVGELVVSSGLPRREASFNGSNCETDPLWSSKVMKVDHYGGDFTKNQKIRAIAASRLAQQNLRICQQNFYGSFELSEKFLNCGCCQKCIRTMLVLQQEGHLEDFAVFANKTDLPMHLDRVMKVPPVFIPAFDEIRRGGVDRQAERAIRALKRRSKLLNRMEWAGRRGVKGVFRVIRLLDALERKFFWIKRMFLLSSRH
ncbi:MAG: hypothetical protein R2940_17930 [Syntrophotaleaceae bacterium]